MRKALHKSSQPNSAFTVNDDDASFHFNYSPFERQKSAPNLQAEVYEMHKYCLHSAQFVEKRQPVASHLLDLN